MYKLYSERIRNKDGEPEVYVYDDFPEAFRNQIFYIMADVLDEYTEEYDEKLWNHLYHAFACEKGILKSVAIMESQILKNILQRVII